MLLGTGPRRLGFSLVALVALCAPAVFAPTAAPSPPALQADLGPGSCATTRYPECRRMRFASPVHVTPGANYQTLVPTIGKPAGDGYMVRISGNLVREDGTVPPVDTIHLHHAVWLAVQPPADLTAFFGVGEEKTVMRIPDGYGWRVRPQDTWLLNFMIHNLTPVPENTYVIWDVDFVPRAAAERRGIVPVVPMAIEIRNDDRPLYPVFNVQKGFGRYNPKTGKRECVYPRDRCARFDPYGEPQPGNGVGYDFRVPRRLAGTIVTLIGHLHPGGLRDHLSLVRRIRGRDRERPLFTFEAVYYGRRDPVSWDFGITVTPPHWRVRVKPGDRIRLNSVYDSQHASWYEGMGIVYGFIAPGDDRGVDPFRRVRVRVRVPPARPGGPKRWRTRYVRIPQRGPLTHGHLPENDNFGGELVRPLPDRVGPVVREIGISAFEFQSGDLSNAHETGIPRVRAGDRLVFRNYDAIAGIWHTVTTCKPPCTGTTGVGYPIADALPALDSLELGWTPPPIDRTQASGQTAEYVIEPRREGLRPGRTYTYFCRVHPFMRGAFKVVD